MGRNKNQRKRPLNTSSGSSNMGDLSMDRSIAEEKSGVGTKSNLLHGGPEFQTATCGVVSLRTDSSADIHISDSDKEVSNTSYYSSSGNLCETVASRRSLSLDSRPGQTKDGPTSRSTLTTKTKTLIKKDFLKMASPRRLEGHGYGSDRKEGKEHQHITHPKKKIKTTIYNSPISDKNPDVNDANVIGSDYDLGLVTTCDKVLILENKSCKFADEMIKCQMSEIDPKVTETVSEITSNAVCNQQKLVQNVMSRTENDLNKNEHIGVDKINNEAPTIPPVSSHERQVTTPSYINTRSTVTKNVSRNAQRYIPMTEEQRKHQQELNLRTLFVAGEGDDLSKLYHHKPRQLNKELLEMAGGQIDKVYLNKGILRIVATDVPQKNKLLKLQYLNNKPVKTSLPFFLTKSQSDYNKPLPVQNTNYFVKGVIYGLQEEQSNLDEIALEIGAHHMHRLGNAEHSQTVLVAYPKDNILPPFIEVSGRKYRVCPFVPKPIRCNNCQRFSHSSHQCKSSVICSRCSGDHAYSECLDTNPLKCANCGQGHSAAYKQCPVFIKIQAALRLRAEDNIPFADAYKQIGETQSGARVRSVTISTSSKPTYASKLKTGLEVKNSSVIESLNVTSEIQALNSTHIQPTLKQPVKEFFSFNNEDYKAVRTSQLNNNNNEKDYDLFTIKVTAFILGVLATIDRADSKNYAKNLIREAGSELLFNKEVEFISKDLPNSPFE